jgi:hypothetical protein
MAISSKKRGTNSAPPFPFDGLALLLAGVSQLGLTSLQLAAELLGFWIARLLHLIGDTFDQSPCSLGLRGLLNLRGELREVLSLICHTILLGDGMSPDG